MKLVNIEAERARMGLTRTTLAEKLGVSVETYRKYVNGSPIPSDKLIIMKKLFKCSIDYLLSESQPVA